MSVDELLCLDDEQLARHCTFEAYKSGGPGGQKRNKTSSAVRWTHDASGLSAHSSEFRSQAENRARALHRLRFRLAAEMRRELDLFGYQPPTWLTQSLTLGKLTTNTKNPQFARLSAHVLDVLSASKGQTPRTAALLGVGVANLLAFLSADPIVHGAALKIRQSNGFSGLHAR